MPAGELVLVGGRLSEDDQERVRSAAGAAQVEFVDRLGDRPDLIGKAAVIAGTLAAEDIPRASNMRWAHTWAAGADAYLRAGIAEHPALVTSSAGNGAVPLAEHAMLLMLMLNRGAARWARAQREHRWDRFEHGELNGRTCAIVGLGNCGLDLAAKAKAFHMRVVGLRRRTELPAPAVDRVYAPAQIGAFLAEADFVVVTAALTAETAGLIGRPEFAAMQESACVVTVSRGGIVDDGALEEALREGRIAGAGLDAHGTEPLPPNSPFWDMPNVVVTPHNGATTAATQRRAVDIFVANLERDARGLPPANVVDKSAGY
ncbi:D-2-hydroxyacid dehydrogenase [Streptomonospora sediminis]